MPIPALDAHGLLPVGTHQCTWVEIQQRFCWNVKRTQIFDGLQDFMAQRWAPLNIRAPIWVDGSFTRLKDAPDDIDLVADVSHLPVDQMGPVLTLWFQNPLLKAQYHVDFWFKHPLNPSDLTAFFCYAGLKAGAELGLDAKYVKGILKVQP